MEKNVASQMSKSLLLCKIMSAKSIIAGRSIKMSKNHRGKRSSPVKLWYPKRWPVGTQKKNCHPCLIRYISGKTASKIGAPPSKVMYIKMDFLGSVGENGGLHRQRSVKGDRYRCISWETSAKIGGYRGAAQHDICIRFFFSLFIFSMSYC